MPLLSLGNIQLDQVLGGGIEEDRCTMLVGNPGSGKTTLALQFITDPTFRIYPVLIYVLIKNQKRLWKRPFIWMAL